MTQNVAVEILVWVLVVAVGTVIGNCISDYRGRR